jgi:hypothetical protein
MSKTKLSHTSKDGNVGTRTTAREYTHVVLVDYHANHVATEEQVRERYEYMKGDRDDTYENERYHRTVNRTLTENRDNVESGAKVLSWHGSKPLATKAAKELIRRGYVNVTIEAINNGERN